MSLIHWWPLNGDLQDKVSRNNLVNTNTTYTKVNSSGKFEECYKCTSNTAGTLRSTNKINLGRKQSMFCWVYMDSIFTSSNLNAIMGQHRYQYPCGLGLTIRAVSATTGYISINTGSTASGTNSSSTNGGYRTYNSYRGSTLLQTGKWYHLGLVYDNGALRLYVNGNRENLYNANTSLGTTEYTDNHLKNMNIYEDYFGAFIWSFSSKTIGDAGTHANYIAKGSLCDIRLYNHALSDAEVKELSKALAVHYTFNDVMAEPTTNLVTQGAISFSKLTVNVSSSHSKGVYRVTTTTANNSAASGQIRISFPLAILTAGQAYYFSCKYKVISGSGVFNLTDWCDSSLSDKKTINYGDYYELSAKCATTRTYNSTYRFLDCDLSANSVIEIWDVQLQANAIKTPYTYGSRASMLYNETGLTQPNNTTNIKLSTDTENGTYSLNCVGSTIINTPVSGDISSGVTISCWIKTPTYPTSNAIVFADYNSRLAFGFYGTQNAIIGCGDTSINTISNIKSQWKSGWNHISITKNSEGTVNCYLNGVKLSLTGSANHWSSVAGYSTIGGRNSGSYSTHFTGLVDDYRMYYTCLNDSDVTELYKTKAYITDKGDIEAHEFIEGKTQAQVTSKYSFEADEFYEELYDGYDVLEYLESTGTQYVDTGYVATSTDYTYELDMAPTKIGGFYSYIGFMASGTTPRAGIHEYSNTFMIGANATTNSSVTPVVNERMMLKNHCKSGAQKLYKNNVQIASNATTFNHSSNTLTTHIFGRNYSSGRNLSSIKLYEAKIYEGSTLVRHYIPVRRQSDNAFGLYELLNGTFHANSGSGTFVSGPAITNKSASIYKDQHVSGRTIIEI